MLLEVGDGEEGVGRRFCCEQGEKNPRVWSCCTKAKVVESDCGERIRQEKKRRVNLAWKWRRELVGMGMGLKERFIVGGAVFELVVGCVRVHSYREVRLTIQMKTSFSEKWLL